MFARLRPPLWPGASAALSVPCLRVARMIAAHRAFTRLEATRLQAGRSDVLRGTDPLGAAPGSVADPVVPAPGVYLIKPNPTTMTRGCFSINRFHMKNDSKSNFSRIANSAPKTKAPFSPLYMSR